MSRPAATMLEPVVDGDPVAAAREAALGAAAVAGVRVAALDTLDELERASRVWRDIWSRDGEAPVSSELLRAFSHSGSYVRGAFDGGEMLGALLGFYGGGASGPDHLHSHILGVAASARGRGVGTALKLDQRAWALEHGVDRVTWTYDPLVRGNGAFNIVRLGATGAEYLADFYGDMPDVINGGDRSDRVLVRWDLLDGRAVDAAAGVDGHNGEVAAWLARGARIALEPGSAGEPRLRDPDGGDVVLCATPPDIVGLRRADIDAALAWRAALREAMAGAMARGLRITAMTGSGSYVLTR